MDRFEAEAIDLLRRLTGRDDARFREGQLEAIRAVAYMRANALVVQRTGWGKSAVYLIATRLIRAEGGGPTVIISPLLALMRNQLDMTHAMSLRAATINSTNRQDWEAEFDRIKNDDADLLLISPERLNNPEFRSEVFPSLFDTLGLLVIDEVHCISDWGHDFRPDYRRLREVVSSLPPGIPVLGTTATANDRVVADIEDQLGTGLHVFRGTLERDSLSLHVLRMPNKAHRMAWLSRIIPTLPGSGIVYCLTIKDAEIVSAWLRAQGIEAAEYTGPMEDEPRRDIEQRLMDGSLKVVVATSALGMGYDNPRIEFVIHYQTPGSPVAYYQQVGRAGRAVDQSYGIALSGWEDEDIQGYFINTAFPTEGDTSAALEALSRSSGMRLGDLEGVVNLRRSRIESMLKNLEVEGAVYREGGFWFRSATQWEYPAERIAGVTEHRRREQEAMRQYLKTEECLMEFLRRQLNDPGATRCGRCASCAGPIFTPDVDPPLVDDALAMLRRQSLTIDPRKIAPAELRGLVDLKAHRLEPGRCLTRWGDPGLAALVEQGKYRDGRFADELVKAAAELVSQWGPSPRPTWVTWIPSSTDLIEDFARRLAAELGLTPIVALQRVERRAPQKTMANSSQQARNVIGAFGVVAVSLEPVLLIDDMVDSRWTLTVAGSLLRAAGSGPVYPFALADTSQRGP